MGGPTCDGSGKLIEKRDKFGEECIGMLALKIGEETTALRAHWGNHGLLFLMAMSADADVDYSRLYLHKLNKYVFEYMIMIF